MPFVAVIENENNNYLVKENVLFDKEGKKLIYYPSGLENEYYFIPKGVEQIEKDAFSLSSLTSLYFSDELKSLSSAYLVIDTVATMKKIVPEFKSLNSTFEKLD